MLYVWADQQAGQSTEWSVPFLGLESSDLLWFLKIILLLPPSFLDQTTEARRAQKNYETAPPNLRVFMTPPPTSYLKVWIHHYLPICESRSC